MFEKKKILERSELDLIYSLAFWLVSFLIGRSGAGFWLGVQITDIVCQWFGGESVWRFNLSVV